MYRLIIIIGFWSYGLYGQSNGYTIPLTMSNAELTPVDATTYYFGFYLRNPASTVQGTSTVIFDKTGTIGFVRLQWISSSTTGSNENVSAYIRLNNTTDYLIQTLGNADKVKNFINTSINIPFVANDYIEVKIVCPTWTTNPANVNITGWLFINPTP